MSGGASAIRGFVVQTLVALLNSFDIHPTLNQFGEWARLEIEPVLDDTEKVDILWHLADGSGRALQVKSTTRSFQEPQIRKWAGELLKWDGRFPHVRYELCLVGVAANETAANTKSIPLKADESRICEIERKNNDTRELRQAAAFLLSSFMEKQFGVVVSATRCHELIPTLETHLKDIASGPRVIERKTLIELIKAWFLPPNVQGSGIRKTVAALLQTGLEPLPEDPSPARLLLAKHEVVAWDDDLRRQELETLEQWTHASRSLSVRLFTGPGGSGKTRLFVEWCKRLRDKNWDAGLLPNSLIDKDCTEVDDVETLVTNDRPTFLFIDYAESRGYLEQFLTQACALRAGQKDLPPLRIALLARAEADWYLALRASSLDLQELLDWNSPVELREVPLDGSQRDRALQRAVAAFAEKRKVNPPAIGQFSLHDDRFERVLYIHMAALALVDGLEITADSLLSQILQHETDFWILPFDAENWTSAKKRTFERAARRWVAALTLFGGAPDKATAERLRQAADGPDVPEFLDQLGRLYPGTCEEQAQDRYLSKMTPDLLGEELVSSVLTHAETDGGFLCKISEGASPTAIENAFTVLGHLAWRHRQNSAQWIKQLLEANLEQRAEPALRAAKVLGEKTTSAPIGQVLAEVVRDHGTLELAKRLDKELPEQSVSLRELAVCVVQKQLETLSEKTTEAVCVERARLWSSLGVRLGELGQREAAMAAAAEAVTVYRTLAAERPDAFLPDVAMSLNNLGNRLSELGSREAALAAAVEAVQIRRTLAAQDPDKFLPDLTTSFHNLGNIQGALGQREAALAAAEEAVRIRRTLVAERSNKFLPDLAGSLNNLSGRLSALGHREAALAAAEEAVTVYRTLAADRPDAFLPDLATSLTNLGNSLRDCGQGKAALAAAEESVRIRRPLAVERPDAFLPDLAGSLNNVSVMLSELGRLEEALAAAEEAFQIRRNLAVERPDVFLPYVAGSLNNMGNMLSEMGRLEEALAAAEEAVRIQRTLAAERPDAFLSDLAMSLNNLGIRLHNLGRREEALAASREAVQHFLTLTRQVPKAFQQQLLIATPQLFEMLEALGREPKSEPIVLEVIAFLQSQQGPEGPG
jgi:tetratricopeptide (TPR) repeat protein